MIEDFEQVLAAARAGEEWAVEVLWRSMNPRLVRFLGSRCGDAADDVAAQVWLTAAQRLSGFDGVEVEFRAWLFTIARRRAIDHHRRSQRDPVTAGFEAFLEVAAADDPEGVAVSRLGTEAALALVGRLPADQAEVIVLRVLGDLDVAQVADIVQKSPSNVRVLQHRGLRRLRRLLESVDGTQEGVTR